MTTTTTPRTMIARYPGRCMSCAGTIHRGSRIAYHGRGRIDCYDCLDSDQAGVTTIRFSSGAVVTQRRSGRCEDAPCCGCCS